MSFLAGDFIYVVKCIHLISFSTPPENVAAYLSIDMAQEAATRWNKLEYTINHGLVYVVDSVPFCKPAFDSYERMVDDWT